MKYHYQEGIVEKDIKGHKKAWFSFFVVFTAIAYGGFIFTALALNGYPLQPVDTTAKLVKDTKPGSLGNRLFIPAINLNARVNGSVAQSGNPAASSVKLKGNQLAVGVTPDGLRDSSPFFNLDKLRKDDEIFLDSHGTRYVYRIVTSTSSSKKLTLQSDHKTLTAEGIGTIAWSKGSNELKTF